MIPLSCQTGGNPSGVPGTLGKSACGLPQGQRPIGGNLSASQKAPLCKGSCQRS